MQARMKKLRELLLEAVAPEASTAVAPRWLSNLVEEGLSSQQHDKVARVRELIHQVTSAAPVHALALVAVSNDFKRRLKPASRPASICKPSVFRRHSPSILQTWAGVPRPSRFAPKTALFGLFVPIRPSMIRRVPIPQTPCPRTTAMGTGANRKGSGCAGSVRHRLAVDLAGWVVPPRNRGPGYLML